MATDNRFEQIRARLDETDDKTGATLWHDQGCDYARSSGDHPCNCIRSDVEYLVRVVGKLYDRLTNRKNSKQ